MYIEYVLAVSLDCSGAFDCIKFDSAKCCMSRKGVPNNVVTWYDRLLRYRLVHSEVQGQHRVVAPARGSPQGGVLSPLIWNLIMDTFLSQYRKGPIKVLGYADDILLYVAGIDPTSMGEILQTGIDSVVEWGQLNGLSFNPKKTKMVLFTKRRKFSPPIVKLEGEPLELSDSFKYLGIEIHRKLSWSRHITERINKCKSLLIKSKGLIGQNWGLTPDRIEWIHKAIIRPKLCYGAVVWASKITQGDTLRMKKLQRLSLLLITRPLRSTPTAGLEVLLGWLPLYLYAQEMGLCTYIRLKASIDGRYTCQDGHLGRWNRLEGSLVFPEYPRETRMMKQVWIEPCGERMQMGMPIHIYTDASKEGDNVGYAWAACDNDFVMDQDIYSAKESSVFLAEVMAIREALSWIKRYGDHSRAHLIWSDSLSAVNKLKGHLADSQVVLETMSLWRDVGKDFIVEINWTKGHANTTGNEYADALARQGAEIAKKISFATPFHPASTRWIKRMIHAGFMGIWQSAWDELDSCRTSRLFYPEVREEKITSRFRIHELQELSKIVTGHGLWKKHIRHWKDVEDYSCMLCGEDWEYPWHLWAYCPGLSDIRQQLTYLLKNGLSFERTLLRFFQDTRILNIVASNEAEYGLS